MENQALKRDNFSLTFDYSLATVLLSFFDFQSAFPTLSTLNKQFNSYFRDDMRDYIWRQLFTTEFLILEYPDHKKSSDESYLGYFKRSFDKYKEFRSLIKGIIDMTNEMRQKKQYGFLRDYSDRLAP